MDQLLTNLSKRPKKRQVKERKNKLIELGMKPHDLAWRPITTNY